MRNLLVLSILLMQATFSVASPKPTPSVVNCDYARFEVIASISEPSELEIELTGELFLAPSGMRIVATNTLTNEELWIVIDPESSRITFLFPDTLNGVYQVLPEDSPVWTLLNSGFEQGALSNHPDVDLKDIKPIKIRNILYTGTRYETESGGFTEIYWETNGDPMRLVLQNDSNNARLDFLVFEHRVEVSSELFKIGKEFAIREASEDEPLNPFML